jgi:hypothetical protein
LGKFRYLSYLGNFRWETFVWASFVWPTFVAYLKVGIFDIDTKKQRLIVSKSVQTVQTSLHFSCTLYKSMF